MSGELLPRDIELIPSFFTDHQHVYDAVFFSDVVQDTIIAQAKFPRRQRIRPKLFDAACFLLRLMAEMKLDTVKDDPLRESSEPAQVTGRLIRDINGIRISHARAQKTATNLYYIIAIEDS
jgi:hypothetical protein